MKLKVNGRYHNQPANLHFDKPGIVEVDEKVAQFLLRDAPGTFELVVFDVAPEPESKSLEAPPRDKQVKAPAKKK